jgi:hypothetical protein
MRAGSSPPTTTQKTLRILGLCLLAGLLIYLLTRKTDSLSVTVHADHLSLAFTSGDALDINFKDIRSVTETERLDLGTYISGIETTDYQYGVWDNADFGKYHLCIYARVERYIVVRTAQGVVVLNFESVDATDSFAKAFMELLQSPP